LIYFIPPTGENKTVKMRPLITIHDHVHFLVWAITSVLGTVIMTTLGVTAYNGTGFYADHPDPKVGAILIGLGVSFIPSITAGYILACGARRFSQWLVPIPQFNDSLLRDYEYDC
jgi:hypothetical protein